MMSKNGKKDVSYHLRLLTNLPWQWHAMWRKPNLSCTCFNSSESQESCDSLAKINFVKATFRKFDAMHDHIKNAEASRNYCIIYRKSKHSCKHCIYYNESWLNNKTKRYDTCLFVPSFYCCCWYFIQLSLFAAAILILKDSHICYAHKFRVYISRAAWHLQPLFLKCQLGI